MSDKEIIQEIDKAMKLGQRCAYLEVIIMIQDRLMQKDLSTNTRVELLMLKQNIKIGLEGVVRLEVKDYGKE